MISCRAKAHRKRNVSQKTILIKKNIEDISNKHINFVDADIVGRLRKVQSKFRALAKKSKIPTFSLRDEAKSHGSEENTENESKEESIEHDW